MIEITDRVVDETFRRGIADLVAHVARPSTEIRHRRIPILVAIAGIATPLAALATAALLVIAGHAQRSVAPAQSAPATPSIPQPTTAALGKSIAIGATVVPAADVTVEKVVFASGSVTYQPAPANGLYAVADVLVSMPAGAKVPSSAVQYTLEVSLLSDELAQLQTAIVNNDVARAHALQALIARNQITVWRLALYSLPFNLEYVTRAGQVYPAWAGNRPMTVFAPSGYSSSSPDGVTDNGVTSLTVIFDVPTSGGAIELTDSQGKVIGRWRAPASPQP
jgi:hypothetical protein